MSNKAEIIKQNLAFMYGRNQEDVKHDPDKRSLVRTAGRSYLETDMITNFSLPEFEFLSPNYPCVVYLSQDKTPYPSYEHALQASKTRDMALRKSLSEIVDVKEVKRKVSKFIQVSETWKENSLRIAEQLLRDKFFRHKELQMKLMKTEHRSIRYVNNFHDLYWGMDEERKGQNHYGKLIESIRDSFENDTIEKKWISDHFKLENPENLMIRITSYRQASLPPSQMESLETDAPTRSAPAVATEIIDPSEETNQTFSFEHLSVLHIGKTSTQNHLVLETPTASRSHALLLVNQQSQLILIDLNSANGTYLHTSTAADIDTDSGTVSEMKQIDPMVPYTLESGVTKIQFGITQRRYVVEVDLQAERHRREELYSKLSNPTELFPKDSEAETTIFVGNLSYSCSEADLTQTFSSCGSIRQIKIPKDPATGEGRGIAFVIFETIGGLRQALVRDGDLLNGRPMKVKRSEAKSDPSKRTGGAGVAESRRREESRSAGDGSRSYYQPNRESREGGEAVGVEKQGHGKVEQEVRRREDNGSFKKSESNHREERLSKRDRREEQEQRHSRREISPSRSRSPERQRKSNGNGRKRRDPSSSSSEDSVDRRVRRRNRDRSRERREDEGRRRRRSRS
jgi:RNA recognition motif-containing protein/predicted NAD-dependent protein-ADP-ribosyltransferase YbiA (DUF1768 family)